MSGLTRLPAYVRDTVTGIVHRLVDEHPACGAVMFGSQMEFLPSVDDVDEQAFCAGCWA